MNNSPKNSLAALFAAVVVSSLTLGACDKGATQPPAAGGTSPAAATSGEVLATVGGTPILKSEVDAKTAEPLQRLQRDLERKRYEMVEGALQQLVQDRLLEAEATARGITKAELIASVPQPSVSAEEVEAFFQQNRAQLPPGRSKEQLIPQIRQYLGQQRAQLASRQFLDGLAAKHKVEIKLEPQRMQVAATGPSKGAVDAKIELVEFSDFQCPYCSRFAPTMDQVMAKYGDRVRLVFRHLPLPIHAQAPKAAEASLCAQDQGKFWEMHDALFRNQGALQVEGLKARASELGLDAQVFASCLDSGSKAAAVAADAADARKAGIDGTPALFVNGRLLDGAVPFEQVAAIIEDELKRQSGS
jgi:protein-disulfide isomerase